MARETGTVLERRLAAERPVSLRLTLGPLQQGSRDPSTRFADGGLWRASRTPFGPATTHISEHPPTASIVARAWGPGAAWTLENLPGLVGAHDGAGAFEDLLRSGRRLHPVIRQLHRRLAGLRIPRTAAVTELAVPTILAQKVTGIEAKRSYAELVCELGEPAPGPVADHGLLVPPAPAVLARTPTWVFHLCGVERKRADTIRRACSHARRLDEALGDADAVSLGDFHLPNQVAWALAGRPRGDDEEMLALLEPYSGHRGRVQRLLEAGGVTAPRFGARLAPSNHRRR
jgi:hypothetical protein